MYSGAELTDDKESPLPGTRREENEKTREKMQHVRSQMENMSLMKENKAKVCWLLNCITVIHVVLSISYIRVCTVVLQSYPLLRGLVFCCQLSR